jgi:hypothetical protein
MGPDAPPPPEPVRRTDRPNGLSEGRHWLLWSALAILGLYGAFVGLLWATGLLDFGARSREGETVAAVLGLLGGFLTSSLTFVGVLLKHSLDERSQRLAALEAERNAKLEADQERRLALEASIKAVELLSTPDGSPAPATQQAGALFALARLSQLDLALTLLSEIWPTKGVSAAAAVRLVDQALREGDTSLQQAAAETLESNASRLLRPDGDIDLPTILQFDWPKDTSLYARESLIRALGRALATRPYNEWNGGTLNFFILELDLVRRNDPAETVQTAAVEIMQRMCAAPGLFDGFLYTATGRVELESLKREIEALAESLDVYDLMVPILEALGEPWLPHAEPNELEPRLSSDASDGEGLTLPGRPSLRSEPSPPRRADLQWPPDDEGQGTPER